MERDGCGVGFLVSLENRRSHDIIRRGLTALERMEHRGGVGPDGVLGDGAGIMTGVPYELFGREAGTFAVASLLLPRDAEKRARSLKVFEDTFWQHGLKVQGYRDIPLDTSVISPAALASMPGMVHALIERPEHCRTLYSFERLLYMAKQSTRTKEKEHGIHQEFYFTSLSGRTIVYKGLCTGAALSRLYPDLRDPRYQASFALFHRRFSTNTISTWDKVQPFRLIAHNGEINTIEGNKAWAITREKAMGLKRDELITHEGISDSGNLNVIAEALRYRSSIPKLAETMAILMPPAGQRAQGDYYKFWGRGMEPWDGPAMVAFSDGKTIGARLDRNGFRPCRWMRDAGHFYLASEAGVFDVPVDEVLEKGALSSGESVTVHVLSGAVSFLDPEDLPENRQARFDHQTTPLGDFPPPVPAGDLRALLRRHRFSREEVDRLLVPMAAEMKEPLGSMGDTACLAFLSRGARSLFDFFYQDFAQVTNPPLDYIREKVVTDMRVYLGRKPNIFEPKDLVPLKPVLELEGPVLTLGQMQRLHALGRSPDQPDLRSRRIDITVPEGADFAEFKAQFERINHEAIEALKAGFSLLVLSDRAAGNGRAPMPSLLVLTSLNLALNATGRRMRTSLILEVGDARNPHQIACLLGHGASAVCPYPALRAVSESQEASLARFFPEEREKRLVKALSEGVLRVMAKMGISVFRSYQGSRLFTPVGLSQEVLDAFFPGKTSPLGGHTLEDLHKLLMAPLPEDDEGALPASFLYREHPAGKTGEEHTLTTKRARAIHAMLKEEDEDKAYASFREHARALEERPTLIRHLFAPKTGSAPAEKLAPLEEILATFGSGAMSFGAISAESQRDLILAFREIGGRSNSGEGGENPYYATDGITSTIKQVASGRFGVTAEYLVTGDEAQIKIAQGAKPGEGGQLMGAKVTEDIARARHTLPGVDLISPPPQHDIYSIEDLKELIHEIKQLRPALKVSVKLVSGANIGAIAVGVAKAGADIIQVSGGDGGTGAASLLSMKHAGLPLEIGLWEVHRTLVEHGMRSRVLLRADGGFLTGKDLVVAALLGADQFDFGKLLLVGQGCIMARVCEKNTCPAGIATHAPALKAKYTGDKDKVVRLLRCLARDVRETLASMGQTSLATITGANHLLTVAPAHADFIRARGIRLDGFLAPVQSPLQHPLPPPEGMSPLNRSIIERPSPKLELAIRNTDRAVPATLAGLYALKASRTRADQAPANLPEKMELHFQGSAGQGFGVFNVRELSLRLEGEANDSVAKGMSGGQVVVVPPSGRAATYRPGECSIIGNCALYGATGGTLLVNGRAGDRFAVRNSGAAAVVFGVGFHACEYMSGGEVWILATAKGNIGAGMSGGAVYLPHALIPQINADYVMAVPLSEQDVAVLRERWDLFTRETGATLPVGGDGGWIRQGYVKIVPRKNA